MARYGKALLIAAGMVISGGAVAGEPAHVTGGGGLQFAVYEAGNPEGPPILFIHGITQSHLSWGRQMQGPLAEDLRLVAMDLRGHGASDKPLDAAHYTDSKLFARDIHAVIRSKSLERPVLVGWSYGGYVIADYLRHFGDGDIGGIVLVGVSPRLGTEEAQADLGPEFLEAAGGLMSGDVRTNIEAVRNFLPLVTEEPLSDEVRDIAFGSAMMVPPAVRRALLGRELDNADLFASVDAPAIIAHGRHDRIVRLGTAREMAEVMPNAELKVYDDSGHAPFLEEAERFNRDLAAFVRNVHPSAAQ